MKNDKVALLIAQAMPLDFLLGQVIEAAEKYRKEPTNKARFGKFMSGVTLITLKNLVEDEGLEAAEKYLQEVDEGSRIVSTMKGN